MISQVVVVLWLVLSVGVILWGLFSGNCSSATRNSWKPVSHAKPSEKVAEALKSGNLEQMLLALDRRCSPSQRSKLLKAILEESRKRQEESPEMKRLHTAIAHQCEKEAPVLAKHGLESVLAEIANARSSESSGHKEVAHSREI